MKDLLKGPDQEQMKDLMKGMRKDLLNAQELVRMQQLLIDAKKQYGYTEPPYKYEAP